MQTLLLDDASSGPGATVFVAQGLGCARLAGLLLVTAGLGAAGGLLALPLVLDDLSDPWPRVFSVLAIGAVAFALLASRLGKPFGWRIQRYVFSHDDGELQIRERQGDRVREGTIAYRELRDVVARRSGTTNSTSRSSSRWRLFVRRTDGGMLPLTTTGSQQQADALVQRIEAGLAQARERGLEGTTHVDPGGALREQPRPSGLTLSWELGGWLLGSLMGVLWVLASVSAFALILWDDARWIAWPVVAAGVGVATLMGLAGVGKALGRGEITITPAGITGPAKGLLRRKRPHIALAEVEAVQMLPSSTGEASLMLLRAEEVQLFERLIVNPRGTLSFDTLRQLSRIFGVKGGDLGLLDLLELEQRVEAEIEALRGTRPR